MWWQHVRAQIEIVCSRAEVIVTLGLRVNHIQETK